MSDVVELDEALTYGPYLVASWPTRSSASETRNEDLPSASHQQQSLMLLADLCTHLSSHMSKPLERCVMKCHGPGREAPMADDGVFEQGCKRLGTRQDLVGPRPVTVPCEAESSVVQKTCEGALVGRKARELRGDTAVPDEAPLLHANGD
ncbi:uncharacterized protein SPSK_00903 [Sporothrix schenckii 1099-18]|uniref:Uncharacterized protein n=1 Tax=Sporothrix schenckii 1099-18 TaxID=1397361 RepID=A0A0F2LYB1_SPOSC|nr:uncharacterized protein SPSK_00903 [Sporothrix schenckii 1099-18]KJR81849.1 hypothetical protein SPSK_00903 [Sporothrix schenckii 1099-18]